MAKEVVISSHKLNSYKFWVQTSGIDISQYQKNPILLWMHNRPFRGTTDEVLPLGRIENLRIDGDKLIGTPVFDQVDDFSKKIAAKWDSGTLKMVSIGIDVIETSEEESLLVAGQMRPTVTKCKLKEVSIVDLGSNDDALVLSYQGKTINLADGGELDFLKPINNTLNNIEMKAIALKLGLPENATEEQVLAKIGEVQLSAADAVKFKAELDQQKDAAITLAVENAVAAKKITDDKKAHFITLGQKVGLESLNETLNLMQGAVKPTNFVNGNGGAAPMEYNKLSDVPADKLVALRDEEPEKYAKLYKAEYGVDVPKSKQL